MKDIKSLISHTELLSDLGGECVDCIASSGVEVMFHKDEPVLKSGEIGRYLWIIIEGTVEVSFLDSSGNRNVLNILGAGDIFGEMSVLTGEPVSADIVARESVSTLKIPRELFSSIIIRSPATLKKFCHLISVRKSQREEIEELKAKKLLAKIENEDPYGLNFSSASANMKILVINCGSSSLKYSLFDTSDVKPLFEGLIDKVGTTMSSHKMSRRIGALEEKWEAAVEVQDIGKAFYMMEEALTDPERGAIKSFGEIKAAGHRVVHGGDRFSASIVITPEVKQAIKDFSALAPLHNPYNLAGIEEMERILPKAVAVAVFDTAFHQTMPGQAYNYAIPFDIAASNHIRRYGFHGTNHNFVALMASVYVKRPLEKLRIITCHFGNGVSICAIDHGRSADTSMGLTPLEGMVMGTRCGDLDPGLVLHLSRRGLKTAELDKLLNKESGLKGLSGISNDMREVIEAADAGDARANNAISIFCYRARKYVGAYTAILGGVDLLIFTGGIGENSSEIRARVCQGLDVFGIVPDEEKNRKARVKRGLIEDISSPESAVRVLVVSADEERMIARETIYAMGCVQPAVTRPGMGKREIPISVSVSHVHLSQADFEALFGAKAFSNVLNPLSNDGGQLCRDRSASLIGPKGKVDDISVSGPFRDESQVDVSRTDEFKLGLDAPIRNSGDLEGTPGITLESGPGRLKLQKGVILSRRHVHMSPEDALAFGLRDKDVINVKVDGIRETVFGDCLVKVSPDYNLCLHLDTDEANAAGITQDSVAFFDSLQSREYV